MLNILNCLFSNYFVNYSCISLTQIINKLDINFISDNILQIMHCRQSRHGLSLYRLVGRMGLPHGRPWSPKIDARGSDLPFVPGLQSTHFPVQQSASRSACRASKPTSAASSLRFHIGLHPLCWCSVVDPFGSFLTQRLCRGDSKPTLIKIFHHRSSPSLPTHTIH